MEKIYAYLFDILAAKAQLENTNTAREPLTVTEAAELYKLAKKHDLAHMISDAACLPKDMPEELSAKLLKARMISAYRHAQQRAELDKLSSLFEDEKIPFLPLKGTVLREYYPNPSDRTSSDIDVYVEPENLDRAVAAMSEKLGYTIGRKDIYDVSTHSPSGVHVELHFSLGENDECVERIFNSLDSYTIVKPGCSYQRVMPPEYFYAYHVVHMAKHFVHGGSGIRTVLDLAIMNQRMPYDKDIAENILSVCGTLAFSKEMENLSRSWFSSEEYTALTQEMSDYIVGAGAFGTLENSVAISGNIKGGRVRYLIGRVFAPYDRLKLYYPRLEKHPMLLPYYQIKRWCRLLFTKSRKRALLEIKKTSAVTSESGEKIVDMCSRLGLI